MAILAFWPAVRPTSFVKFCKNRPKFCLKKRVFLGSFRSFHIGMIPFFYRIFEKILVFFRIFWNRKKVIFVKNAIFRIISGKNRKNRVKKFLKIPKNAKLSKNDKKSLKNLL